MSRKRFCSKCGAPVEESFVGAENYIRHHMYGGYRPYSAYNKLTGQRQLVPSFQCPNYGAFHRGHDSYMEDELILEGTMYLKPGDDYQ